MSKETKLNALLKATKNGRFINLNLTIYDVKGDIIADNVPIKFSFDKKGKLTYKVSKHI